MSPKVLQENVQLLGWCFLHKSSILFFLHWLPILTDRNVDSILDLVCSYRLR